MRRLFEGLVPTGLWRSRDFRLLWGSFTITAFGAQVTFLALPLTAALVLSATPWQMGVLVALEAAPFALVSLFAGVWIDRRRKLPLVVWSDAGRGVLLALIPLAAAIGWLSMGVLYAVGFLCGVLNVVGGAAAQVLITQRFGRQRLLEANAKIGLGQTGADTLGPGLAGLLVQALTAPFAIALDALAFLVSGWMLRGVRPDDPPAATGESLWREIGEGLRLVWDNRVLRSLAAIVAAWQLLHHMYLAVIVLFATRELGLTPGWVGAVYTSAGVGCLLAVAAAGRMTRHLGVGPTMLHGLLATVVAWEALGLVGGGRWTSAALLSAAMMLFGFGAMAFTIAYLTLRQAVTPDDLLGRMTATMRFLTVAAAPLGSLAGGAVATGLGLRATLWWIGGLGLALAAWALASSPVRRVRDLPTASPA